MENDEAEFWNDTNKWPRDAFGFVFLGNAVDQVGAVMFGEEWSLGEADKRAEAAKKLHDWFLDEGMKTALRDTYGGKLEPVEADFWHNEYWDTRFMFCELPDERRGDPYANVRGPFGYIFVDADNLKRLIGNLTGENIGTATGANSQLKDVYLSPYMRLALAAIRHHGITEKHHDTKTAIEAWVKDAGKRRGLKISNNVAAAIATVIRHPNAQFGKAKPPV